ncbi:hypothetical protein KM043_004328 [Ampulex compressa]|nr:hypothetical protein KM043_004328 [Ampulex compressa]
MVLITEIETRMIPKPALGGWRHKITGTEYFNGASQTGPPPKRLSRSKVCSRIVQTVETRDGTSQSPSDRGTQMWRRDCQISNENDKCVTSIQYETYEELQQRLDFDNNARIIQKNYRAYRLFKFIKECAQKYRRILEECKKHDEEVQLMYRKRHEEEILRKIYPASRADLFMLYELIEKWRRDRFEQIKVNFFRSARGSENHSVLQKTVEMMNVIENKIRTIKDDYRSRKRVRFLTINCEPIRWNGYKGKRVEMVTLKTQKARELKSIYDSLRKSSIAREERIETLMTLKKMVGAHSCAEAIDLIRLLDQEISLRVRDIQKLELGFLRERIIYGFLRFLRVADYCGCLNNNVDQHIKPEIEELLEPLEPKTKLCKSCLKLLPYNRFTVHGRMKKLTTCNGG